MIESAGNSTEGLSAPQPAGQIVGVLATSVSVTAIAALLYAPLAWGAVTPGTRAVLEGILLLMVVLDVVYLKVTGRPVVLPRAPRNILLALLAFGWWMALNAKQRYYQHDGDLWLFEKGSPLIGFLPGGIDRATGIAEMIHISVLALAFFALCGMVRLRRRRWLLLKAVGVSGFVVALIGLYQKVTGATWLLWADPNIDYGQSVFAAFRYHGHAAAFLNLCWPATLVVLMRVMEKENNHLERAFWAPAFVFTFVAPFFNTPNAGQGLAIVGFVLAAAMLGRLFVRQMASRWPVIIAGILLVCVCALAILPTFGITTQGWSGHFDAEGTGQGRLAAYADSVSMLWQFPVFGSGPGTFGIGFPYYNELEGGGFWDHHAHQEYLQTFIEWGIPMAFAWFALFGVAYWKGWQNRRNRDGFSRPKDLTTDAALIALTIVGLHAMVDFPLRVPANQILVVLYLAILWRDRGVRPTDAPAVGNRKRSRSRA